MVGRIGRRTSEQPQRRHRPWWLEVDFEETHPADAGPLLDTLSFIDIRH